MKGGKESNMSYKIFIASRSYSKYSQKTKNFLKNNNCELYYNQKDKVYKEEDLLEIIDEYDCIVVGVDEVTEKVIKKGVKNDLKIIAKNGVGVDNIDLNAADKAGIPVINAPGTNSDSVADLTVALMLSLSRSIPVVNNMTKNGQWKRKIGNELWEKTIGIIGTGAIGKRAIKRLTGFNCDFLAFDLEKDKELAEKYNVKYTDIDSILKNSDFISLHLPLNDNTEGLIDQEKLSIMKENAFLVNTARGGIVDEDDLYQALKNQEISGAAFDVFAEEPPEDSKLFNLDNFIATPHIGAFTYETNERTGMKLAKNIIKVFNEKEPNHLVNNPERKR